MSKRYFVKYGDFGNTYSLRWADSDTGINEANNRGYEQITRKRAIELCCAERYRRAHDSAFSGYADTVVYPIEYDSYDPDYETDTMDASGYIVVA